MPDTPSPFLPDVDDEVPLPHVPKPWMATETPPKHNEKAPSARSSMDGWVAELAQIFDGLPRDQRKPPTSSRSSNSSMDRWADEIQQVFHESSGRRGNAPASPMRLSATDPFYLDSAASPSQRGLNSFVALPFTNMRPKQKTPLGPSNLRHVQKPSDVSTHRSSSHSPSPSLTSATTQETQSETEAPSGERESICISDELPKRRGGKNRFGMINGMHPQLLASLPMTKQQNSAPNHFSSPALPKKSGEKTLTLKDVFARFEAQMALSGEETPKTSRAPIPTSSFLERITREREAINAHLPYWREKEQRLKETRFVPEEFKHATNSTKINDHTRLYDRSRSDHPLNPENLRKQSRKPEEHGR
ncbi:MAG: hypothetical protein ABW189_08940 [Rickettsiales bacterium]